MRRRTIFAHHSPLLLMGSTLAITITKYSIIIGMDELGLYIPNSDSFSVIIHFQHCRMIAKVNVYGYPKFGYLVRIGP